MKLTGLPLIVPWVLKCPPGPIGSTISLPTASAPASANPNVVASSAIKSAIGTLANTAVAGGLGRRAQQGRWVRRGNSIVILGA